MESRRRCADLCRHECMQRRQKQTATHIHRHKETNSFHSLAHVHTCLIACAVQNGKLKCGYGWSVFIMDPPLGGDVEEEEVLNLHNPFPLPAFKSPLFFSFLVSLPICSCQSTHGRKIRAFHCGITPDSSLKIKQG